MARRVKQLVSVREGSKPNFPDRGKPTDLQRAGLRYEASIQRLLERIYKDSAEVIKGPWLFFEDSKGHGIGQPDAVVVPKDETLPIIVVEVKLSKIPEAKDKLKKFYKPLVEKWKERPVAIVQIYKHAKQYPKRLTSIHDLLKLKVNHYYECHYC